MTDKQLPYVPKVVILAVKCVKATPALYVIRSARVLYVYSLLLSKVREPTQAK